jgi:hypothetical protein
VGWYPRVGMCSGPLNFKMFKIVDFLVEVFYHNKTVVLGFLLLFLVFI